MNHYVAVKRSWFALLKKCAFLVAMVMTTNALGVQPAGRPPVEAQPPDGALPQPAPGELAGQSKDPKYVPLSEQVKWNMSKEEIAVKVNKMIETLNRRKPVPQAKLKTITRALGEVRNAVVRDDARSYGKAIQTLVGKSKVLSASERKRVEDALGEADPAYVEEGSTCSVSCMFGSCTAKCGGRNGGAACGCAWGFPVCGCGGGGSVVGGGGLSGV